MERSGIMRNSYSQLLKACFRRDEYNYLSDVDEVEI